MSATAIAADDSRILLISKDSFHKPIE